MTEQTIQPKDDRLLTPRELAERWGVSLLALRKRRSQARPTTPSCADTCCRRSWRSSRAA